MKRILNLGNVSITLGLLLFGFIIAEMSLRKANRRLTSDEPVQPAWPVISTDSPVAPAPPINLIVVAPFSTHYDCQ